MGNHYQCPKCHQYYNFCSCRETTPEPPSGWLVSSLNWEVITANEFIREGGSMGYTTYLLADKFETKKEAEAHRLAKLHTKIKQIQEQLQNLEQLCWRFTNDV